MVVQLHGSLNDADLQRMEDGANIKFVAPYVLVTLARTADRPDSTVRRRVAEFTKRASNPQLFANAVILPNALVAGALTAIRWLSPAAYDERAFSTLDDGLAWLTGAMERRGLEMPAAGVAMARHWDANPDEPRPR